MEHGSESTGAVVADFECHLGDGLAAGKQGQRVHDTEQSRIRGHVDQIRGAGHAVDLFEHEGHNPTLPEAVGSESGITYVWVIGGLVTLCLALCVAELSTMFPRAGGAFVYLRESFGAATAFAYGWTYLLLITPSAWATIALVFAEYSGAFVTLNSNGTRIVATVAIGFVTVVNVVSVRLAAAIQNVATSAKMLALAAIIGVLFGFGDLTHGAFANGGTGQAISLSGFIVGLVTALWAYDGVVPASSVFGEVRDPALTLPRALVVGVLAVTVIYLGMNAALLYVMPVSAVGASKLVAADAMRAIAGQAGASVVAAALMLTTFGALASAALCDPRVMFATHYAVACGNPARDASSRRSDRRGAVLSPRGG